MSYLGYPCWAVSRVATVNSGTGDVTFALPLLSQNGAGAQIPAYTNPAVPGQAIWAGTQPADLTFTRNIMNVPVDFSVHQNTLYGQSPKGSIETKAVATMTFEGNIITGYAATFAFTTANQNGGCPWCTTSNVIIRNNFFQSYRYLGFMSLTGYGYLTTQGHDILFTNNLAVNADGIEGTCFRVSGLDNNFVFTHNTCVSGYPSAYTQSPWTGAGSPAGGYYPVSKGTGLVIRDNLSDAGNYTASCTHPDVTPGTPWLACFNAPAQDHNMFVLNVSGADPLTQFPGPTNTTVASWAAVQFVGNNPTVATDWRLLPSSPGYHAASDGKDVGVDIDQLVAALAPAPVITGVGRGRFNRRGAIP